MKYYLLFAIAFVFSCKNAEDGNKPKQLATKVATTISGTIANPNDLNVIFESKGEQHSARITDGQFSIELMLDEPHVFTLKYARRTGQIFVLPGDKINFSTTANQFSQVMQFTGDRSAENNYLTKKFNEDRTSRALKSKTYKLEEPEFTAAVDQTKVDKAEAFKTFCASNEIDPFFKFIIDTEIEYEWANDRLIYPTYYKFYNKKENFDVSPVYFDFQRNLDLNDPGKLFSPNFVSFINNYTDAEANKALLNDEKKKLTDNGMALTKFDIVSQQFKNKEIQEFLMYNTLKTHIKYEGANGTTPLMQKFEEISTNLNLKRDIQNAYSMWRGLEEGAPAPNFAYADIDGQVHDMANYKGKYIYVDVWATWCGPCKKELPHLEALQEAYKDNDKILFTSVSIDKNKDSWERMVKDKNMKGLQLFAENEWRASIIRDYKISGIPRFLLIDDQGKIVSANAPRPSSPRIKAKLGELIGAAL